MYSNLLQLQQQFKTNPALKSCPRVSKNTRKSILSCKALPGALCAHDWNIGCTGLAQMLATHPQPRSENIPDPHSYTTGFLVDCGASVVLLTQAQVSAGSLAPFPSISTAQLLINMTPSYLATFSKLKHSHLEGGGRGRPLKFRNLQVLESSRFYTNSCWWRGDSLVELPTR